MNKILKLPLLLLLLFSCGNNQTMPVVSLELIDIEEPTNISNYYKMDCEKSSIYWTGFKPGSFQVGEIALSSGEIILDNNRVVGGEFTIDINSITVDKLSKERAQKLADHLKNSDFFEADKYPTATFKVAKVDTIGWGTYPYSIQGNLTIKEITNSIQFNFNYIKQDSLIFVYSEPINLNRTEWGITYKSTKFFNNLKDNFIDDNFQIEIKALFKSHNSHLTRLTE